MTPSLHKHVPEPHDDAPMIWIRGGEFTMGSDHHYAEEHPRRRVSVDGFWIDRHPVTNREFAAFVRATGYITVAEQAPDPAFYPGAPLENLVPGSMVFVPTRGPVDLRDNSTWWRWIPGANWHHPRGPGSSLAGLVDHPVVQVSWDDVATYAAWRGRELPTEAEWEFAARGGLDDREYTWGDDPPTPEAPMANIWQGAFPWRTTKPSDALWTSPVGAFPPNGYDLVDMAGNVWEWTADWWTRDRSEAATGCSCCVPQNPRGGAIDASRDGGTGIPQKVVKGGSHLCAPDACFRYRPAARQPQMVDTGMSHVGFRCVIRGHAPS